MPIYEFQCSNCHKKFEKILSISDSNKKVKCESCENALAKKIVSAPSFRLDGKGWYETDFKTGTKKNLVQSKDPKSLNKEQKNKSTKKEQPTSKT